MSSLLKLADNIENKEQKEDITFLHYEFDEANGILKVTNGVEVEVLEKKAFTTINKLILNCMLPANCSSMFSGMKILEIEYGPLFNSCDVVIADKMFADTPIKEFDAEHWDFSRVESMEDFCGGCYQLQSASFKGVNFPVLRNASFLFFGCRMLTHVDMTDCSMPKVLRLNSCFALCEELTACLCNSWKIYRGALTLCMFQNCKKLSTQFLPKWAQDESCW